MKHTWIGLLIGTALAAQSLPVGTEAPAIVARPLDASRPFPGWDALHGNIVVVDFWATWCGPCLPALDNVAKLEKEFAGQPIRFFTVASDEADRVKKYFTDKALTIQTFVEGEDGKTSNAWAAHTLPATAIVDRQGRILAVTSGENVSEIALRKALNGEKMDLPAFHRSNNIFWDRDEIQWQDGVQPLFQVVIKPIDVSGGGVAHSASGNRISGDGASLDNMIQSAWQTDHIHLVPRIDWPKETYRFAAVVPVGRKAELLPALQDAIQRSFAIRVRWEEQERDVLILSHDLGVTLQESQTAEPASMFQRGKITMKKQTIAKLANTLPNWMGKVVVDETGLTGLYDLELEYRNDGPAMLTDGLKQKYGLVLTPEKRKVKMLVVEPKE